MRAGKELVTWGVMAALILLGLGGGMAAQEVPLEPFPVSWESLEGSVIDLSFLLEAPAGRSGFIGIRDGHLASGDGQRIRFWGVNVSGRGCLPPKEHAPLIAERLARWGINCVRFHFFDRPAPNGIIDASRDDTRQLDPAQLDRLDYFIAQLKERGIYTDLNLNVARSYKRGDGVRDWEYLGFAKGLTYFDPVLLELQREYARQLLTHRNPYTGNEYRQEPGVALIELVNENSLVEAWMDGRLRGTNTRKNPGTWTDITASYAEDLTRLYNRWLEKNVPAELRRKLAREVGVREGELIPRLSPEEFARATAERFDTEARFYMEIEREYFINMKRFLREELGVKQLIIGNSDHGHSKSGYPIVVGTALLDVIDGHVYWQHPSYIRDPETGRTIGFRIPNTPMVVEPLRSTVVQLARTPVLGRPYTVSEVNHPFPHQYACEGIPILAAYGAFQDWDGIFWYTLAHGEIVGAEPRIAGHFDLAMDPVKMCQLVAGALAFLRGDVRPAEHVLARSYTPEQVRESIRLRSRPDLYPLFTPGLPAALPLKHALRVRSFEGPPSEAFPPITENPIVSDTGELRWWSYPGQKGLVTVDAPRWQAIVGHLQMESAETSHMKLRAENAFGAITLSALDDRPLADARRILITACGQVANRGQRWNLQRTSLEDWGTAPTVIEVIRGSLLLKGLGGSRVFLQPLDAQGRPLGDPEPVGKENGLWVVPLGKSVTTWYLLTVEEA
ncbi:MAG: hypothetical protein NZ899_01180 [Thermoguttaceae bacterium]|nr:hypothetical protein [Thermoguttaceae bacterium]MDW8077506.1 hypothetical protein [Thermoguttaceae bacterium]